MRVIVTFRTNGFGNALIETSGLPKEYVRGLPVRLFVATNRRPLSLGLSGHEEFEETIQTLLGHLLLYVVPGGERLYGHEVAREFAPHRRIFVGRRSPSCPPEDE